MHNENDCPTQNESQETSTTSYEENNIPQQELISDSEDTNTQETSQSDARFKEGQVITMVNVRFPGNSKPHPFYIGKKEISYGQKVIAMSDRGMTLGYVNSFPYDVVFESSMLPIRTISQIATADHISQHQENANKEREAELLCKQLIEKHQLEMVITHVELTQFGKKVVFYFNAPQRVDFRGLVKDLVSELRMRIELRQISVRDRAASLGAVATCGLQTCCSYFLKNYGNVSIKMAKNQNLTLLPGKINGVCGQIKCCMKYENDIYSEKRTKLPKEGNFIITANHDKGKVLRIHVLEETFEMLTDQGIKRHYHISQYNPEKSTPPSDWSFPQMFDHVTDETSSIIGLPSKEISQQSDDCSSHCYECNSELVASGEPDFDNIGNTLEDDDSSSSRNNSSSDSNQYRSRQNNNRYNKKRSHRNNKNKYTS